MVVEYDLLIRDATIVDGTGRGAYKGSIGVKGDRIVALGEVRGDAVKEVDASGLLATPGFVDSHSHSDGNILFYPLCESDVHMGVTTFVGGQCGSSPAPVGEVVRLPGIAEEYVFELEPFMYFPRKPYFPLERVNELLREKFGWTITWRTMGEYFKVIEERGFSINYAPLVGHGACRTAVLGNDYERPSTPEEVEEIGKHIRQALDEGCIGLSAGIDYDPDCFASREEIDRHVAILRDYPGAVYAPHWRRTGRRRGITAGIPWNRIQGIIDELETARKAGVPIVIAHLYGGWDATPIPPPKVIQEAIGRATLDVIDRYIAIGVRAYFDVIPYWWFTSEYLCGHFAPFLRLLGSREAFARALRMADFRQEVREALQRGKFYIQPPSNPNMNPNWAREITITEHKNPRYLGRTIAEIASEAGRDPMEAWFDLIVEDPDSRCSIGDYRFTEDYVKLFYKHPRGMVGVDSSMVDDKREGVYPPWGRPGPNTYSAYPSFLNRYVKEQRLLTLEEAVRKCTALPAEAYNLERRGTIEVGSYADILLIDWENLRMNSTPRETRRYPTGFVYVFVNGVAVIEKDRHTGARPGRVLRRKPDPTSSI
jgi:N-acyl-D-amino-acid deacylase